MKKLITLLTLVLLAVNVGTAQSDVEEVDFLQSIIGAEKKAFVADFIDISPAAKDAFWSLYVKQLGQNNDDAARRFIALVDEFYERNVTLIISAEKPITELYTQGNLNFEFKRCISRLQEMQSLEYLAREHLA